MKFDELKFIADENQHPKAIKFLTDKNISIISVFDKKLNGRSDELILQKAFEDNRVVLTHDADFGKIIFTKSIKFVGILYLRPGHFDASFTIATLEKVMQTNLDFQPPFIAVAENKSGQVRIRLRNNIYGV